MTALLVASCCSVFATLWAIRELRIASTVVSFELRLLRRKLKGQPGGLERLDRALRTEADTWEAQLVRVLVGAQSRDVAQSEVNSALLDVDGKLSANTRTYAACARIAVFGCLIGAAWLFMTEQGLTTAVVDVFAIGAAGVLSTLSAGKEAQRLVRVKRRELDEWVEDLLRARFPDEGMGLA